MIDQQQQEPAATTPTTSAPIPATPALDGSPATTAPHDAKVREVELMISNLLKIGVRISLSLVVLGTILSFAHHPEYLFQRHPLQRLTTPGEADLPHTIPDVWRGLKQFQGQAIVVLGLLLLIVTPVMRVAVSILGFVYEKDRTYTLITTIVLVLLILSFVLGKAE
jgi:uncharacterized membrane protein